MQTYCRNILTGFARLLRFNPGFAKIFRATPRQAFWSFIVMAPAFLFFALAYLVQYDVNPTINRIQALAALIGAFLLVWLALPVVIILIGKFWQRQAEALSAVYFNNLWSFVWTAALTAPSLMLHSAELPGISMGIGWLLISLFYIASLIYAVYALRTLLRIDGAWVVALIAGEIGISYLMGEVLTPNVLCTPIL